MLARIKEYYNNQPLSMILILGLIVRLVSVVFSSGYGMHDDHYLVIEAAQSWIDGFDYNNWLPENSVNGRPTGHSFFYVGLHFIFLYALEIIGITDPMNKLLLVRLVHGLFSLATVYLGYKLAERLSDLRIARIVGMLLALYWFYPILSVRSLVEVSCVPFILASFYILIRRSPINMDYLLAGVFIGLAIAIRIQSYLLLGGVGLVLLFERKWIGAIIYGIASMVTLFLTQITDLFLWGYPFAEMGEYIFYNSTSYDLYITMAWYQYIVVIAGLLLPPVSLFLLFGFFRTWKKYALIFVPILIFLIFHSIYPNKQERFILPIIPLFIILGSIGWISFKEKSAFWLKRKVLYKNLVGFFWILNTIALIVVSPAPSKKSWIESMHYLYDRQDVTGILVEHSINDNIYMLPRFYSDKWDIIHFNYRTSEKNQYAEVGVEALVRQLNLNYCFFIEDSELERRIKEIKEGFPEMELLTVIEPSYIDKFLHWANPRNKNEMVYIYKLY